MNDRDLLRIRNSRFADRRRRRRRSRYTGSRSINHNGRCSRRRRSGSYRINQNWRCIRRRQSAVRRDGQKHVMGELGLVGACATDVDATVLTTGYGSPIRQGDGRMATVPPDHHGIGRNPILKAALQQSSFLVPGIKSASENRPVACRVRDPRSQS
jgi:hypothetical protein